MIRIRRSADRGRTAIDWLDSRHTFSFGEYHDPAHTAFRALRVINDDRVRPASGFGPHPHRDMEIVTLVLQGALEHRDSLGNGSVIRPGEVQRMTAARGIVHSEWNPSETEDVHLLQIWMMPRTRGRDAAYEQRPIPDVRGAFALVAGPGDPDAKASPAPVVTIDSDTDLWRAALDAGTGATLRARRGGGVWVHVARGDVTMKAADGARCDTAALSGGDGAAIDGAPEIVVTARTASEVLVFDLA